jgi:hypothetical protein
MDYYHIWCNLKDSSKDLEFSRDVAAYLGHLMEKGLIIEYKLTRRKFGFSPDDLGEFHIIIAVSNLQQLEQAFQAVATRTGEVEKHHHPVYSAVTDFKSALYRDFPDPVRGKE